MFETGGLGFGNKLPFFRELARARRISITTVIEAYRELEATDLVEARARSGYYVKFDQIAVKRLRAKRRAARGPVGLQTYRDLMPELLAEGGSGRARAAPRRRVPSKQPPASDAAGAAGA
jgi:DNA-binding transcriptional MocR family regulator